MVMKMMMVMMIMMMDDGGGGDDEDDDDDDDDDDTNNDGDDEAIKWRRETRRSSCSVVCSLKKLYLFRISLAGACFLTPFYGNQGNLFST